MDQQLKIVITAEAAGVPAAVDRATNSLKKLKDTSGQSTQALVNLSRVAQDAPYGFIGIANNLNPLLESFQRLRAEAGSNKAALSSLVAGLTGPAGIGLALGVVSSLMVVFTSRTKESGSAAKESAKELKTYAGVMGEVKGEYEKAFSTVNRLRTEVDLAKKGFIDKNDVVKEYNKTLGDTIGKAKDLNDVEQLLVKNGEAYIKFTLLKAAANLALDKAADAALKSAQAGTKFVPKGALLSKNPELSPDQQAKVAEDFQKRIGNVNNKVQGEVNKFEQEKDELSAIANDFFKQAAEISKKFNFNFSGLPDNAKSKKIELPISTPRFFIPPNQELQTFKGIEDEIKRVLERKPITAPVKLEFPQFDPKQVQKFLDMRHNMELLAKTVSGVVVPAFEKMFDAIKSGENPIKAFFKSIGDSVLDLIQKLIAAAIQAAILSLVTGGASGGGVGFIGAFKSITGIAGGGNINVARGGFGNIAGLGFGGGAIQVEVTGRMRGQDIILSGARTGRQQRRNG